MALRLAAKLVASGQQASRRLFNLRRPALLLAGAGAAAGVAYTEYRRRQTGGPLGSLSAFFGAPASTLTTAAAAAAERHPRPERGLNWRERHFLANASLQYDGVAYMSPLDFLRSVALSSSDDVVVYANNATDADTTKRQRKKRHVLAESEYMAMIRATPGKRRASDHLFRDISSNGLISYPEFLLLLNILSKSSYGFQVAFRAFDRDSDGRLDASEFRRLYRVVSGASAPADPGSCDLLGFGAASQEAPSAATATSLLVHFFGSDCRDSVSAAEFARFADNLQREVLLVEFRYCCGVSGLSVDGGRNETAATMAPLDFGQAVLRRTRLTGSERRLRLDLLEERVWQSDRITAEEYRQFFQFLLHTDDLFFALRMFEISGQSIDQDDFQRAVKAVTGQGVSPKLLTIVFALFDVDGDGALSYGEFLNLFGQQDSVLRNHCLACVGASDVSWREQYRKCVKKYMVLQQ